MEPKTVKAAVELTQNDEGLWLNIEHKGKKATILLTTDTRGPIVRETLQGWADNCFLLQPAKRETTMKRLIAFVTGGVALVLVAAATGSALTYAILHGTEALTALGNAALQGVGIAIGGCLGGALVMRFKVARHYVKNVLHEINEKHLPPEHVQ